MPIEIRHAESAKRGTTFKAPTSDVSESTRVYDVMASYHISWIIVQNDYFWSLTVGIVHWSKRKLDRLLSGVWMGRHDQTALTSGREKSYASSFEPMNTDIYCDVCIINMCVQRICITPVLLYAMKYVNVVLCLANARDRRGDVE